MKTRTNKAPRKLSNDEKAMGRVLDVIKSGKVLTVSASSGYYTVGAYTPAVGPRGFAVYGYGGVGRDRANPAREFTGTDAATSAAWAIVSSCGCTRAREAAIRATPVKPAAITKAARREIDRAAKCGGVGCRRLPCPICDRR